MKKNLYFAYYSVTNAMSNYGFFSESATICFVDLPVFLLSPQVAQCPQANFFYPFSVSEYLFVHRTCFHTARLVNSFLFLCAS